jgi:hypothetical protein
VAVLGLRPTAKKIAEKFDNLFLSISAGRKPSTYVMDCFAAIDAAGSMSGPDLVKALQAHDYTIGTARSQSQQVMSLFTTLKVCTKSEGKLTINGDSVIAAALRTLSA